MSEVEVICLANSRKPGGRCVAGLQVSGAGWIRPLGDRDGGAVLVRETVLDDGSEAGVLDVIRVSLAYPKPDRYQPENWVLEPQPWKLVRRPTGPKYGQLLEENLSTGPDLFGNHADRISMGAFAEQP